MHTFTKKSLITVVAAAAWMLAVAVGLRMLFAYESSAGSSGAPPRIWPPESRLERAKNHPTLVMLAHPRCPCTRASIDELAELMARVQGRVSAVVLFMRPHEFEEGWERVGLWESAAAIPGVTVMSDEDGSEAHRFEIETSGHTLLFDGAGRLIFSGGITSARGHSGENAGRSAITALLRGGTPVLEKTLVFGCSLFDRTKQKNTKPWLN